MTENLILEVIDDVAQRVADGEMTLGAARQVLARALANDTEAKPLTAEELGVAMKKAAADMEALAREEIRDRATARAEHERLWGMLALGQGQAMAGKSITEIREPTNVAELRRCADRLVAASRTAIDDVGT